jgi:phage terminase small subunit
MRKPKQKKLIMASPNGYPVQNPYLAIRRRSVQILRGLANDLGLSPVARSRITVAPTAPEEDEYEKLKKDRDLRLIQAQERFKKQNKKKK